MRPLFSIFALTLGALVACEVPPPDIERPGVDQAIAMSRFKTACVGLRMKKDADLRAYTAKKLAESFQKNYDAMQSGGPLGSMDG